EPKQDSEGDVTRLFRRGGRARRGRGLHELRFAGLQGGADREFAIPFFEGLAFGAGELTWRQFAEPCFDQALSFEDFRPVRVAAEGNELPRELVGDRRGKLRIRVGGFDLDQVRFAGGGHRDLAADFFGGEFPLGGGVGGACRELVERDQLQVGGGGAFRVELRRVFFGEQQ